MSCRSEEAYDEIKKYIRKEQTKDIKTEVKEIKSEQVTMRGDISELKNAPLVADASKWKTAVTYICTALGGAVVSYLISLLFPLISK